VAYSLDGRLLASSSADQSVKVWDARTGRLLRTFLGHTNQAHGLAFAPDSRRLASSSADGTVKVWDVTNLEEPPGREALTLPGRHGSALGVVHCPSGRFFATINGSDIVHGASKRRRPPRVETVTIWDARTGKEIRSLTVPDPTVSECYDVAFDSAFGRTAWARGDGTVEIRDATSSRPLVTLARHTDLVGRVAFSPDGRWLASAGGDGTVRVWDAATGRQIHILSGVSDIIIGLEFSLDGRHLALAGADLRLPRPSEARIWETATGRQVGTLGQSFDEGTMAFHPDGRRLARSIGADILILDMASGLEVLRLRGHTALVSGMAFNSTGGRLASAGHDGTVKLWDMATGREILSLIHGKGDPVTGVSISPDGLQIVSTSESGTIKVWDATPLSESPSAANNSDNRGN
jgi:WD40 repeat protein